MSIGRGEIFTLGIYSVYLQAEITCLVATDDGEGDMMVKRILVVANNKGGVAKTNTASSLGEYAAQKHKRRVLLLDLDPQCDMSNQKLAMDTQDGADPWLSPAHPDDGGRYSVMNIFEGGDWAPYSTATPGLDILPCNSNCRSLEAGTKAHREAFLNMMNNPAIWEAYDLVIIDTPPAKNLLTETAIMASTHVLIPCVMEQKPFSGLMSMLQLIDRINAPLPLDQSSTIVGIVPTKFDPKQSVHRKFKEASEASPVMGPFITKYVIRESGYYKTLDATGSDKQFDLPKNSTAYKEWMAMGRDVLGKLNLLRRK